MNLRAQWLPILEKGLAERWRAFRLKWMVIGALSACALTPSVGQCDEAQGVGSAVAAARRGEWREASQVLNGVLTIAPNDADARYLRAALRAKLAQHPEIWWDRISCAVGEDQFKLLCESNELRRQADLFAGAIADITELVGASNQNVDQTELEKLLPLYRAEESRLRARSDAASQAAQRLEVTRRRNRTAAGVLAVIAVGGAIASAALLVSIPLMKSSIETGGFDTAADIQAQETRINAVSVAVFPVAIVTAVLSATALALFVNNYAPTPLARQPAVAIAWNGATFSF